MRIMHPQAERIAMSVLLKEERYILYSGMREYVIRVQELVGGDEAWPGRFRIELPASEERRAARFYGSSSSEVVERAIRYLSGLAEVRPSELPV